MNSSTPNHIGIIMDGNGRWAQSRGHNRLYGHMKGASIAKKVIEYCATNKMGYLTLFTFSTENWFRPVEEVSFLMSLLRKHLRRELKTLVKNNVRFRCIGEIDSLPTEVGKSVQEVIEATSGNDGLQLTFALSYGGRQEIVNAVQKISSDVAAGKLKTEDIDDLTVRQNLQSHFLPDPDLIIRTSGESRISNFFLWQAAYSEIKICEKMWPDFTLADLQSAIDWYSNKQRRFGRTGQQLQGAEDAPSIQI